MAEITKIYRQIWVYKNFVSKDDLRLILEDIESLDSYKWNADNVDKESFWYGRNLHVSNLSEKSVVAIKNIETKLASVFGNYSRIHEIQSVLRTIPDGRALGEHRDNAAEGDETNMFGVVVYLNDNYSGGEIFYKELQIEYKPNPGDLVVHYAGLLHGVNQVTEGERYILTSFVKGTSETTFMGEAIGIQDFCTVYPGHQQK